MWLYGYMIYKISEYGKWKITVCLNNLQDLEETRCQRWRIWTRFWARCSRETLWPIVLRSNLRLVGSVRVPCRLRICGLLRSLRSWPSRKSGPGSTRTLGKRGLLKSLSIRTFCWPNSNRRISWTVLGDQTKTIKRCLLNSIFSRIYIV